jgi:hypothetical protein
MTAGPIDLGDYTALEWLGPGAHFADELLDGFAESRQRDGSMIRGPAVPRASTVWCDQTPL